VVGVALMISAGAFGIIETNVIKMHVNARCGLPISAFQHLSRWGKKTIDK
jgi:hypothetical protein